MAQPAISVGLFRAKCSILNAKGSVEEGLPTEYDATASRRSTETRHCYKEFCSERIQDAENESSTRYMNRSAELVLPPSVFEL